MREWTTRVPSERGSGGLSDGHQLQGHVAGAALCAAGIGLLTATELGIPQHPPLGILGVVPVMVAARLLGRSAVAWICSLAVAATTIGVIGGGVDVTTAGVEMLTLVIVGVIGVLPGIPVEAGSRTPVRGATDVAVGDLVGDVPTADVLSLSIDWRVVPVLGGKVVDEDGFVRRTALLSQRQREVARLAISGLTARHIGAELFISERTVETHLANAYERLGVHSRAELIAELNGVQSCAS